MYIYVNTYIYIYACLEACNHRSIAASLHLRLRCDAHAAYYVVFSHIHIPFSATQCVQHLSATLVNSARVNSKCVGKYLLNRIYLSTAMRACVCACACIATSKPNQHNMDPSMRLSAHSSIKR